MMCGKGQFLRMSAIFVKISHSRWPPISNTWMEVLKISIFVLLNHFESNRSPSPARLLLNNERKRMNFLKCQPSWLRYHIQGGRQFQIYEWRCWNLVFLSILNHFESNISPSAAGFLLNYVRKRTTFKNFGHLGYNKTFKMAVNFKYKNGGVEN